MKALVSCLSVLLLVPGNTPPVQAPQTADSCHFTVSGELAKPTISGLEDITALVHVVEQPDSPVEILAIDFRDSWLSVAHERVTEQLPCAMKVRNRSDQQVKALSLLVIVESSTGAGGTGFEGFPGTAQTRSLAPGQEADIIGCGGGGSGSAPGNHVDVESARNHFSANATIRPQATDFCAGASRLAWGRLYGEMSVMFRLQTAH